MQEKHGVAYDRRKLKASIPPIKPEPSAGERSDTLGDANFDEIGDPVKIKVRYTIV